MNWLTVGKFLLAHWQSFAIAGLVSLLWIQGQRIDNFKEQAGGYQRSIAAYEHASALNRAAMDQCLNANAENEANAIRFGQAVEAAAERVSQYARRLYEAESQIANQVESFNDEQCRTLDDPLPGDFVEWLRDT